jgi:bla regulator protein blaR1
MMHDIFIYLLKVSGGLAIIFLPYYFLFRNDPNLIIKRFYLLSGILASWIFPFITFRKLPLAVDLTPTVFIDLDTPAVQAPILETAATSSSFTINWLQVLIFVYLAGISFMFLKNLFFIIKWNLCWQRTRNEEGVAFIKKDQVFTLFTRIFVPGSLKDQDDLDNVLLHEKAHIHQLHFIDLMLMEFTLLLTWFNPFSWLISRMIKENHEHLADREVLSAGVNPARYRAQLMNHTLGVNVFRLGTQFNHSLTLKRFKMMKKPNKSPLGIIKIALLIPAVLFTLGLTTGMTPQQKTVKGKVIFADTGEHATGASVVIARTTTGCVVDKDGTFELNVDGNPDIAISFVGYETIWVKASDIGQKPLKLEVESYEMDLESVPEEEEVYFVVDEMPTFNGGDPVTEFRKYLSKNLTYPKSAAESDISGRVIVQFTVTQNGDVADAVVVRSVNPALDKESLRVVNSSPKWTPGKQQGKAANVIFTFPVNFVPNASSKKESKKIEYIAIMNKDGSTANPVYLLNGKEVESIESINSEDVESINVIKDPNDPLVKKYNAKDGLIIIKTKDDIVILSPKESKETGDELASNESDEPVFFIVEEMPEYPGGLPALKTFIYYNLEYPEKAKAQGKEGEAKVRFLINENGEVQNSEILSSSDESFNAPALHVINKMPNWTPGHQRGKAVKVWYVVSIKFNNQKK